MIYMGCFVLETMAPWVSRIVRVSRRIITEYAIHRDIAILSYKSCTGRQVMMVIYTCNIGMINTNSIVSHVVYVHLSYT